MIMPNRNTRIGRLQELGLHTEHMLSKFPDRPRLAGSIEPLRASGSALESAELAYKVEARALNLLRTDVRYESYLSNLRVRRTRKQVEIADGRRGGRLDALIFPGGAIQLSRMQAAKQIDALHSLETRLTSTQDLWPEAAAEQVDISVHRVRYTVAVTARDEGVRRFKDLALGCAAAKERFLQCYAEVVSLVAAEFPRDRYTQEMFFLSAYERPGRPSEDDEPPAAEPPAAE